MHSGFMQGLLFVYWEKKKKRCLGREEFVQEFVQGSSTLKDQIQEGILQMAQIFLGTQQQERKQILPNTPS